ncbi:MAG: oligosaccharide flippase family protein [Oscillospiraceae bacterium]|nr:oligosaccharide flippase family protein [Oscillospiraceae bacterium]
MQTQKRSKLFIENILVYGLGGMISKFIPLIMLPIIVRLYPNKSYMGLNDLSHNFISFAAALAVCGMYDAMFRLFFDSKSKEWQQKVCSTAFLFVTGTSLVLFVICLLLRKVIAVGYFDDSQYVSLTIVTVVGFLVSATNQIVSAPTRIQNKRKVFLVTNTVSPFISYAIAVPLILKGYYIMAMPIATVIAAVTLELSFAVMNRSYFSVKSFDKSVLKDLLKVGLPLLPNFLIYWVYNSSDKWMINKILNAEETGTYAVASRIGHISNLIYTAFAGGWLYFAYSTMDDDDQIQMKSRIFEYMSAISFAATVGLMAISKLLFTLAFPADYLSGYLVAPYLFLAPLSLMLYQILANQFTIVKKTYMNLLTLSIGAVLNIVLNLVLIRKIGIEGASIATMVGYLVSIMLCVFWLRRMKLIAITKKTVVNVCILLSYFIVWRLRLHSSIVLSLVSGTAVFGIYLLLYKDMLLGILKKRRKKA